MIKLSELNPHNYPTTPEQEANLAKLLDSLNIVRKAYGKPLIITSGLRSTGDQARINPTAPHSKHLLGAAADISDPHLEFNTWLKGDGAKYMEEAGLFGELETTTWTHLQVLPFGSYKEGHSRWFKP